MTQSFDRKVHSIFNHALALDATARHDYLQAACGTDIATLIEVKQLLQMAKRPSTDFSSMLTHQIQNCFSEGRQEEDRFIGTQIDSFQVIKLLGVGGMGRVYLARQASPRRFVAIKIIKPGMDSAQILQRFHQEREILARLDHPCIAKIIDAGQTDHGYSYFVMEYIDGIPVVAYCNYHRLRVDQRLDLMIRICQAVQHAHQRGIIHRDLKPSNILVTTYDDQPLPKIIDFGIAKALGGVGHSASTWSKTGLMEQINLTASHAFLGSLGYVSPEQALVTDIDVDTRTDVYTLGVLLYELLVGVTPFEEYWKSTLSWDEMFRQISAKVPLKPSLRLESLERDVDEIAKARGTSVKNLKALLRHDLDWITLRALEKEKDRRYASPADLAKDLDNHLRGLAVDSGPPSISYRMRKYVTRNKGPVASVTAILFFLFAGLAGTLYNSSKVRTETEKAKNTLLLFQEFIDSADPFKQGAETSVRDLLDAFAKKLDGRMTNNPEIRATLLHRLGQTYAKLNLHQKAHGHVEEAYLIRNQVLGKHHLDTMDSRTSLGIILGNMGQYKKSTAHLNSNIQNRKQVLGSDHPDTLFDLHSLATLLVNSGHHAKAEPILRQIIDRRQDILGPNHRNTLETMMNLGILLTEIGRYEEAETWLRLVLDGRLVTGKKTDVDFLVAECFLGKNLMKQEKYDQAEPLLRESWTIGKEVLGEDHQGTLYAQNSLALTVSAIGRHDEALNLAQGLIPLAEQKLGHSHPATIIFMQSLAIILVADEQLIESESVFREAIKAMIGVFGEHGRNTLDTRAKLALTLEKQGKLEEAIALLNQVSRDGAQTLGPDDRLTKNADRQLRALQEKLKKTPETVARVEK